MQAGKTDKSEQVKTCKMNVVSINGRSAPECTACGHRFNTESSENPYRAMCRIAMGEYRFCPCCGAKYAGCQVEGIDLDKTTPEKRDWILRGNQ